jgi:zinc transporter 1
MALRETVRSASFILLQGAPSTIPLQSLRQSIQDVPGVLAMHELHVWQLSESKIIASVHVWVDRSMDYMSVAANIREALHEAGVHSCTIQPEFHDHEGGDEHLKVCRHRSLTFVEVLMGLR